MSPFTFFIGNTQADNPFKRHSSYIFFFHQRRNSYEDISSNKGVHLQGRVRFTYESESEQLLFTKNFLFSETYQTYRRLYP